MNKLFGGTLVLALASLGFAAPQAPAAGDTAKATETQAKDKAKTTGKHHAGKHAGKAGSKAKAAADKATATK